jgi:hypothetical protein
VSKRRWEGDERRRGMADARAFVPQATQLVDAMQIDECVTEDPHAHLLPHLERALDVLPLVLERAEDAADGTLELDLLWTGAPKTIGEIRAAIYALVGSIAEAATFVRQHRAGRDLRFDVVTGMLADAAPFAPHGHTLRLRVVDAL